MKQFLILAFVFLFFQAFSQNEKQREVVLSYAPGGLFTKLRIKAEVPVMQKLSVGSFFTFHYFMFKGFDAEPFCRYYMSDDAPRGFYSQLKLTGGYYSANIPYVYVLPDTSELEISRKTSFPSFGIGFSMGYQFESRRGRLYDIFLGYKYQPYTFSENIKYNGDTYWTDYDFNWYIIGPGSQINCHFGIAYSF